MWIKRKKKGREERGAKEKKDTQGGDVKPTFPRCSKCGKNHGGKCLRESGACFRGGQLGPKLANCPNASIKGRDGRPRTRCARTHTKKKKKQDGRLLQAYMYIHYPVSPI